MQWKSQYSMEVISKEHAPINSSKSWMEGFGKQELNYEL